MLVDIAVKEEIKLRDLLRNLDKIRVKFAWLNE